MFTEHLLCDLSLWPVLKCPPREARIDPSLNVTTGPRMPGPVMMPGPGMFPVTHDMRPLPPLDGGN
jgi:hypothetical protein